MGEVRPRADPRVRGHFALHRYSSTDVRAVIPTSGRLALRPAPTRGVVWTELALACPPGTQDLGGPLHASPAGPGLVGDVSAASDVETCKWARARLSPCRAGSPQRGRPSPVARRGLERWPLRV